MAVDVVFPSFERASVREFVEEALFAIQGASGFDEFETAAFAE